MKKFIPIFGITLLLNACVSSVNTALQVNNTVKPQAENCPKATVVSLPVPNKNENFYDRFNFHILNIASDVDTIKFQTLKQDFVFCRSNNNWTVQPGSLPKKLQPPNNYAEVAQELVNPKFKNLDFQGENYQYRVVRKPQFSLGDNNISRPNEPEPTNDQIVFELITPNSKETQQKTLYTLKDLQAAAVKAGFSATGNQLGFPRITAAIVYGDSLWWSIAFEQGEGNTGIATIVRYNPQNNKFTLIQPPELGFTQITDLAITGDVKNPTFWLGTKVSGEGNLYIPAKGLVAYRPDFQNPNSGSLTSYNVHNSPLVGAIPDKLRLENDRLWVSTANGVCQVKWQAADNFDNWSCWRFTAMAKLPSKKLPLYSGLTNKTAAVSLSGNNQETIEVLWWSFIDFQTGKGRYEVRYPQGFTVKLDRGASIYELQRFLPPGKPAVEWPGFEWHWNGQRFVRGLDEVSLNLVGGGPQGIGSGELSPNIPINWNAMRGDLELLNLSPQSTSVKYYSGWVDEAQLQPYLTVVPQERSLNPQPNPLTALAKQLQSRQ
ncbi:hypothetical protein [Halotia branconii]|uniref:Uncharacterized protein n=1 Tax=Halotia branconii CENA392 TaxID=1539056 RepID=A0AAJ6NNQ3_9CYAN|nr:hypothetical protein [Halotia branconii]WGV23782.1 hypothetical protein QI031_18425 [Halotia branconii CENA392]